VHGDAPEEQTPDGGHVFAPRPHDLWNVPMTAVALAATVVAVVAIFAYAPRHPMMGDAQRVLYLVLASAWCGFGSLVLLTVAGVVYLLRRQGYWDALALSTAEVGGTFAAATAAAVAIWMRALRGVFWTWHPWLALALLQLAIYLAYIILRGTAADRQATGRAAAVYAVAGLVTMPASWFAVRWSSAAPLAALWPITEGPGSDRALHTLLLSMAALSLLCVVLLQARYRLERTSRRVQELRAQLQHGQN